MVKALLLPPGGVKLIAIGLPALTENGATGSATAPLDDVWSNCWSFCTVISAESPPAAESREPDNCATAVAITKIASLRKVFILGLNGIFPKIRRYPYPLLMQMPDPLKLIHSIAWVLRRAVKRRRPQEPVALRRKKTPGVATGGLCKNGRAGEIRTLDLLHPMQARYQATLQPEQENGQLEPRLGLKQEQMRQVWPSQPRAVQCSRPK